MELHVVVPLNKTLNFEKVLLSATNFIRQQRGRAAWK